MSARSHSIANMAYIDPADPPSFLLSVVNVELMSSISNLCHGFSNTLLRRYIKTKNNDSCSSDICEEAGRPEYTSLSRLVNKRLVNKRFVNRRLVSERLYSYPLVNKRLVSERLYSSPLVNKRLVNKLIVNKKLVTNPPISRVRLLNQVQTCSRSGPSATPSTGSLHHPRTKALMSVLML
jgi:hypothetical protein